MERNIFNLVRHSLGNMTPANRRIGEYILNNPDEAVYSHIDKLAHETNVSLATISRFCKSLGFESFSQLKLVLASNISVRRSGDLAIADEYSGKGADVAYSMLSHMTDNLSEVIKFIDAEQLEKSVEALYKAGRIVFFGVGASLLAATRACDKFLHTTNKVASYLNPHTQLIAAETMSESELAVILVDGVHFEDAYNLMHIIHASGASVLTLEKNEYADYYVTERMQIGDYDDMLTGELVQSFLINVLLVEFIKVVSARAKE